MKQIKNRFTGEVIFEADVETWVGYDFKGVDLSYAYLTGVNLSNTDLSHTNLTNAYLYNADLSRANLTDANLTDANLYNADFEGTDLTGVINFNPPKDSINTEKAEDSKGLREELEAKRDEAYKLIEKYAKISDNAQEAINILDYLKEHEPLINDKQARLKELTEGMK